MAFLLPTSSLVRGYAFIGLAFIVVALALAFEHRLFTSTLGGIAYMVSVSGLLFGALFYLLKVVWGGALYQKFLALPGVLVVLLYHLILVQGP